MVFRGKDLTLILKLLLSLSIPVTQRYWSPYKCVSKGPQRPQYYPFNSKII